MGPQGFTKLSAAALALLFTPVWLTAAEKTTNPAKPVSEQVEMFAAMKSGDIEVKLIPKSDREARVLIKNKTKRPLSVKLPDAFAGVPVLAQFGGGGGGRNGGGNNNNNSSNQSMGGGMGGMGGGMGGGGMGGMGGGGMFNVAPEKVGEFKVNTVCLEHGKKDPRPAIPYEIRPIEAYTGKAEVQELLKLFGQGKLDQRAAQAAAWHLANGMSWEELANKRLLYADGYTEQYFQPQELQQGMRLAEVAEAKAKDRPAKEEKSPGDKAYVSPGELLSK